VSGSAWTNQAQNLVIVTGTGTTGVFVYSGNPGPGNPPVAWMSTGTTDPFGNTLPSTTGVAGSGTFSAGNTYTSVSGTVTYSAAPAANNVLYSTAPVQFTDSKGNVILAGTTFYGKSGLVYYALNFSIGVGAGSVFGGSSVLYTGADMTAWTIKTGFTLDPTGADLVANQLWVRPFSGTVAAVAVSNPSSLSLVETWHDMTLLNGWSLGGGGYAQYFLGNDNDVHVRGDNVIPGTTTGGTNVWTIPSDYIPGVQTQRVLMYVEVSTGAPVTDTPRFDATTGGQFQCFNVPGTTTRVGFNGQYSLT
jgi:hypothetical protein